MSTWYSSVWTVLRQGMAAFVALIAQKMFALFEWLLLGSPDVVPDFMRKRLKSVVDAYGLTVKMLLASVKEFCTHELERLRAAPVVPRDEQAHDQADIERQERVRTLEVQCAQIEELAEGLDIIAPLAGQPAGQALSIDEQFDGLLRIDARTIAVMPDDFLIARRWVLLDRFRRIAPNRATIEYEGSLPPSTDSKRATNASEIRADLLNLTNYMQQLYVLNARREQALASIKWWLLTRLISILVIIGIVLHFATKACAGEACSDPWWMVPCANSALLRYPGEACSDSWWMVPALMLIFLTGMIGAITSIARKFQDIAAQNVLKADPFNEIVALNYARQSVAVSILTGGVFALFAYLVIIGGSVGAFGLNVELLPSIAEQKTVYSYDYFEDGGKSGADAPNDGAKPDNAAETATEQGSSALETDAVADKAAATQETESDASGAATDGDGRILSHVRGEDKISPGIAQLSKALGFFYGADILRMLLLAFLAGFAERLVPDSIDRLIRRERATRDAS